MTFVITGPGRRAPWQGAVFLVIIGVLIVAIGLILLGLAGDFLIDWPWFSATGYLRVFLAIIVAKALTFFVVFVATAITPSNVAATRLRFKVCLPISASMTFHAQSTGGPCQQCNQQAKSVCYGCQASAESFCRSTHSRKHRPALLC